MIIPITCTPVEKNEAKDDELIIPSPFEPICEWRKEERSNVLEVHLKGFKSEEVIVERISRNLHIRGESTSLINSRFHKEIEIPEGCSLLHGIYSKFDGGILYITIPIHDPWSSAGERVKTPFSKREMLEFAGALIISMVITIIMVIFMVKIKAYLQLTTPVGQAATLDTPTGDSASIVKAMVQANVGGQNAPDSDSPVGQPTSHPSDGENPNGMKMMGLRMRMMGKTVRVTA